MQSIRAHLLITCIALAAPAAWAAPDAAHPDGDYFRCVMARAQQLAPANATATEVAEASLAACEQNLRDVIAVKFPGASADAAERAFAKIEASARRTAIAVIVGARLPAKK